MRVTANSLWPRVVMNSSNTGRITFAKFASSGARSRITSTWRVNSKRTRRQWGRFLSSIGPILQPQSRHRLVVIDVSRDQPRLVPQGDAGNEHVATLHLELLLRLRHFFEMPGGIVIDFQETERAKQRIGGAKSFHCLQEVILACRLDK